MKLANLIKSDKQLIKESVSYDFTVEVEIELIFPPGAVYRKRKPVYRYNHPLEPLKIKYALDFDIRRWGLDDISVVNISGPDEISITLEVEDIVKEHVIRPAETDPDYDSEEGTTVFKSKIKWDRVSAEKESNGRNFQIIPQTLEFYFTNSCEFNEGILKY